MNKTFGTEIRRTFLLEGLPEPLKPADEHLQFFDNYIDNTRLRLRTIRSPKAEKPKEWTYVLEQRFAVSEDFTAWNVSEIYLNEQEHYIFEQFEGREVRTNERVETNELRFNRYFFDYESKKIEIDIFLQPLWGLNIAKVYFESFEEMHAFEKPHFAVLEVTQNEFFIGKNLVGKSLADVKEAIAKIMQ
jgi:hypothetical protein